MSDFATSATITIDGVEGLSSARQQIEDSLGSVSVGVGGTGSAQRAVSTDGGSSGRQSRRMFRWARQRTSLMETSVELLESIDDKVGEGGGGSALGGALGGMGLRSVIGGGAGAIGGASLGAMVGKVPLKSLLTKAPAFATLVTASDLGADLVTGNLTAEDIIEAPINLGEMVTFGTIGDDTIEGAIGAVTLSVGAVQIAGGLGSLLPTVGLGTVLGGISSAALAKTIGTVGIGAILGRMTGSALDEKLGTTGIDNVLTAVGGGAALAGLLGTVSMGAIVGGTLGSVAVGSMVVSELLRPGEKTRRDIDAQTSPGSNRFNRGVFEYMNLDEIMEETPKTGEDRGLSEGQIDDVDFSGDSDLVDRPPSVDQGTGQGQSGSQTSGGASETTIDTQQTSGGNETRVEYAPQYDVSAERDEEAIIEEVRSRQEDDIQELREEIQRASNR